MKQVKTLSIFMLVALMVAMFVGCSKDDDNSGDVSNLKTYIIGSWHSYKGTAYFLGGEYSGESEEVSISKTGEFSEAYYEIKFQDAGHATFGAFQKDENGLLHWETEDVTYSINGDIVTVRDTEGTTLDLVFNESDKTLCIQVSATANDGTPTKVSIYLKK
jgi:hypothetical protein